MHTQAIGCTNPIFGPFPAHSPTCFTQPDTNGARRGKGKCVLRLLSPLQVQAISKETLCHMAALACMRSRLYVRRLTHGCLRRFTDQLALGVECLIHVGFLPRVPRVYIPVQALLLLSA